MLTAAAGSGAGAGGDAVALIRLLREAGWEDTDQDGILEKEIGGVRIPLSFTIVTGGKPAERYLTMYQHDAKQAGVEVKIKYVDWAVLGSLVDRRAFDAIQMGGGGGLVDFDPRAQWHSDGIGPGGNNYAGFRNSRVDALIEKARHTPERAKRIPLLREVYRIVAEEQPCLFLFNDVYNFYAYSRRVEKPRDTYAYEVGTKYWWVKK